MIIPDYKMLGFQGLIDESADVKGLDSPMIIKP
jgi:hypothetical protein